MRIGPVSSGTCTQRCGCGCSDGDHDAQPACLRKHRSQGFSGSGRHSGRHRKQCPYFQLSGVLQSDIIFPPDTRQMVGVAMGINNLLEVFNEKYYENLDGGILESFGRLFKNLIKLYIYPMRKSAYDRYCLANPSECPIPLTGTSLHAQATDIWINAINLQVQMHLRNLYAHLLENHYIAQIV